MDRLSMRIALLLFGALFFTAPGLTAQDPVTEEEEQEEEAADTVTTYADVITEDFETDEGMFDVHQHDGDVFFEIPLEMLDREMLVVTRFGATPDGAGYGGSKLNESTVRWQQRDDQILLRIVSLDNVADETLPIAQAVANSNVEPIVAALDIEVMNDDSTAVVIEVTDLYDGDESIFGITGFRRSSLNIRNLDSGRSFIEQVLSFPENIEVRRT